MSISQLMNCDYVKTTDIVNKYLLIREINEFNMYFRIQQLENKYYNTIIY